MYRRMRQLWIMDKLWPPFVFISTHIGAEIFQIYANYSLLHHQYLGLNNSTRIWINMKNTKFSTVTKSFSIQRYPTKSIVWLSIISNDIHTILPEYFGFSAKLAKTYGALWVHTSEILLDNRLGHIVRSNVFTSTCIHYTVIYFDNNKNGW